MKLLDEVLVSFVTVHKDDDVIITGDFSEIKQIQRLPQRFHGSHLITFIADTFSELWERRKYLQLEEKVCEPFGMS